ncbi:hypothetical protein KDA_61930 [Dictyobacter alpinus]|uniref:Uncharacterized protein n=1 Tax=Dictyobacter alpinus TaxID=2014873 RepID=A0A402BHA7_9CHLR|nr:hypothetical protein [Dictyobacter alpinus]GCE30709.1 hypothetical protein KDA_61930 [Dictyobacter alpinus]
MVQFKKGMMVFKQIDQVEDLKWGQTAQKRVVLTTQFQQPQDTRGRIFKKGMMVRPIIKKAY